MRAVILNGGVWLSHANGNDDELQRRRRQYGELEKRIYRTSKTGKEGGRRGSEKGEIESHAGKTTNEEGSGPFDATIAAAAAAVEEEEEARELWSDKEAVNALFTAAATAATPPASPSPGGLLVTRLE